MLHLPFCPAHTTESEEKCNLACVHFLVVFVLSFSGEMSSKNWVEAACRDLLSSSHSRELWSGSVKQKRQKRDLLSLA